MRLTKDPLAECHDTREGEELTRVPQLTLAMPQYSPLSVNVKERNTN